MENPAIDLSLVKREPGLDDMYSSDPVIFDGMMGLGEDLNDSFNSSVPMHHEEMPVDWLSNFFDDPSAVPSCAELSYNSSLGEYTTSSLSYHSMAKPHSLGLNGLNIDTMTAFPEECSNESLYCSTPSKPRSPDIEHKPLTPDSETNVGEADYFCPNSVCSQFDTKNGIKSLTLASHMDTTDHDRRLELRSTSSDQESERQDSESGYDSAAHSPTCSTPTTPPHSIESETDCLSGSSNGEITPPCSQVPEKQPFYLTEEEKRTLIAEGLPVPTGLPLTKVEERALKKVRRKIKNKISAQESRRKKKEYMETLEKRVDSCANENSELRKKVDTLENANRSLISQLQKLQGLISSKVPRPSSARSTQTGTCLMVVVMCFAVFLGSWTPLHSNIGIFSNAGQSVVSGKSAVDYSTPSVRSRVLLSVMDDMESDEAYDSFGSFTPNTIEPAEPFIPPAPSTPVATNQTQKLPDMETVAPELPRHNETKIVAASAA